MCQPKGKPGVWLVAGSGGCASGGRGDVLPLLALALVGAWRAVHRRRAIVAALVLAAVAAPATLRAQTVPVQPQFNADRFNPGAGSADILSVGSASMPGHLDTHVSLFSSYARDPLRLIAVGDSTQQYQLLHGQMLMHLGASIGLFDRFELGLTLPMLVAQSASQNDLLGPVVTPGDGIGDLRFVPKALLWSSQLLSVAFAAPLTLPTGRGDAYLSHGSVTVTPEVRVESDALPVRLAASAGVVLRSARDFANLNVGNALTYGVGGELPFSFWRQNFSALATVAGEAELQQSGSVERPMELLGALRWFLPGHFQFTVGGGPGLTDGYGTPRYRIFAGIGFDPGLAMKRAPARPPLLVQTAPQELPPPEAIEVKPDSTPAVHIAQVVAPEEGLTREVRDGHVVFLAQVQFAHDASTILPASVPLLRHVADVLRDSPGIRKVEIQGHTDGRGKPAYNRQLSRRRAQSVLRYLVKSGIESARLMATGFGPDRPRAPNDTPAHRALNRRVEFVVIDGPSPTGATH
jgi:outer membrane protein OmpA-like peptidoglycan-associated protein